MAAQTDPRKATINDGGSDDFELKSRQTSAQCLWLTPPLSPPAPLRVGFGLCGTPEHLIEAVRANGAKQLTCISNNAGYAQPARPHAAPMSARLGRDPGNYAAGFGSFWGRQWIDRSIPNHWAGQPHRSTPLGPDALDSACFLLGRRWSSIDLFP